MEALFWQAAKYQALPPDNSVVARLIIPMPSLSAGRTVFTCSGIIIGTPNADAPSILNSSNTFNAVVEVSAGGGNGMLVTQGRRFGGYGRYILNGKPAFLWNLVDLKRIRREGPDTLAPEKLGMLAFGNPRGIGRGGTGVLKIGGKSVATQTMEKSLPFIPQFDENFDVRVETGTLVKDQCQVPFEFNGKIVKLTLTIARPQLIPADIEKLKEAQGNNRTTE